MTSKRAKEAMAEQGILWLEGGEVLFAESKEYRMNVCPGGEGLSAYATGYREAAEHLFEKLDTDGGNAPHYMLFPLAFLWRQYLELTLKSLAEQAQYMTDENWGIEQDHRLGALWNRLCPVIEDWWPNTMEKKWATKLINEFQTFDPGAENFRYPRTRDGKRTLAHAPERINLRVFHESMVKLANLLDGTECAFSAAIDAMPSESDYY